MKPAFHPLLRWGLPLTALLRQVFGIEAQIHREPVSGRPMCVVE